MTVTREWFCLNCAIGEIFRCLAHEIGAWRRATTADDRERRECLQILLCFQDSAGLLR